MMLRLKYLFIFLFISCTWVHAKNIDSVIKIEVKSKNFAIITNSKNSSSRIGYQFLKNQPEAWGIVPLSTREANIDTSAISSIVKKLEKRKDVVIYKREIAKDDIWSNQKWTFYMIPVTDGIEMNLLVETVRQGLPEFFGIQQSINLSSENNQPVPAGNNVTWKQTPMGIAADLLRKAADESAGIVENGLISRSDRKEGWVCGMYWENTSHVNNSHSDDCLQSMVNIGNIPPYSKRLLRGKLYWFKGSKEDLSSRFDSDFRGENIKNKLTVGSCQFPICGDIVENGQWIKKQMRLAKIKGCDIVHTPEGALSGYAKADFLNFDDFDWALLRSETDSILTLARELRVWVLLGTAHQLSGENKPHNSLYVINPDGEIVDRYDKRFCTSGDLNYYSPGDHFTIFEINNVRCGLLICYDVRFPELYRQYRKLNADVIFQSFNNSRHGIDCIHPKIMPLTARAHAGINSFFMSLTNSSAPYGWPCYFVTPDGLVDGILEANKAGILVSDLDVSIEYYDVSKPYRLDAIDGKLNSGDVVIDPRSANRNSY